MPLNFEHSAHGFIRSFDEVYAVDENGSDGEFIRAERVFANVDTAQKLIQKRVVTAVHRVVERVHFVGHFRLPSFPDARRAARNHISPAGIFGVFKNFHDRVRMTVFGKNVENVPITYVTARAVVISRDHVFIDVFGDLGRMLFCAYAERYRERIFALRSARIVFGFRVEIFIVYRLATKFDIFFIECDIRLIAHDFGNLFHLFKMPEKVCGGYENIVGLNGFGVRKHPVAVIVIIGYIAFRPAL